MRSPRSAKYTWMTRLDKLHNPLAKALLRRGVAPRAYALLETTGRTSGLPRYTPVGNGLDGDTFWLVAVHGDQADYVRNLVAEPNVRVKVGRRWFTGRAAVVAGDDAIARSRALPHQWDKAIGHAMASRPLTVRIDLDRPAGP